MKHSGYRDPYASKQASLNAVDAVNNNAFWSMLCMTGASTNGDLGDYIHRPN